HRALQVRSLELLRGFAGVLEAGDRHDQKHVGPATGDILTCAAVALRRHHRFALGLVAHLAAIASAFEFHDALPLLLPSSSAACRSFGKSFLGWPKQKERGSNLRWSPSTVRALPGMCPNRSCGGGPGATTTLSLWWNASRENLHVVGALGVLGDVEAFTLGFDVDAQTDDHVDHLVEDRRTDAPPHQRGADAPDLGDH